MLPFRKWHCGFRGRCFHSEHGTAVFEIDASVPKMALRFSRSMLPFGKWRRGFPDRCLRSENGTAVFEIDASVRKIALQFSRCDLPGVVTIFLEDMHK